MESLGSGLLHGTKSRQILSEYGMAKRAATWGLVVKTNVGTRTPKYIFAMEYAEGGELYHQI